MCNHEAYFIDCFAGYPGSLDIQEVFELSDLHKWLGDPDKFPDDCYILGDSAYELHQNVIIPYSDTEHLTPKQKNFNFCHFSAKIETIERAFGLLKTRFRSLRTILAMDRCDLIPMFIIACCVIHNICLSKGDEIDVEIIKHETRDNNSLHQDATSFKQAAVTKRNLICERLSMQNV